MNFQDAGALSTTEGAAVKLEFVSSSRWTSALVEFDSVCPNGCVQLELGIQMALLHPRLRLACCRIRIAGVSDLLHSAHAVGL